MHFIKKKLILWLCVISLVACGLSFAETADTFNLYYAIDSNTQFSAFAASGFTEKVESITFGWSRINVTENGKMEFVTDGQDFYIPEGANDVLETAKNSDIKAYLNIYCEGPYDNLQASAGTIVSKVKKLVQGDYVEGVAFDGVVIDLESLSVEDQRNFSAFVWFLRDALKRDNEDFRIIVALQPDRGTDYTILNQVADTYLFMLHDYEPKKYDRRINLNEPVMTPLAPTDRVLQSLHNELVAIGEEPKQDIVVQFSMATAQWKVTGGRVLGPGGSTRPYRPAYSSLAQRMGLLENANEDAFFRTDEGSPYLFYYDESDETQNTIWYEDAMSIQTKIDAAKTLGIHKFSVWRMGSIPEIERYDMNIPKALMLIEN